MSRPQLVRTDFNPRPLATKAEQAPEPLYTAVGRALTNWERVESHLAGLYAQLLGTSVPVGAMRAYGSIATFSARKSMLLAASGALFHEHANEALAGKVRVLVNNVCKEASARRNEVAHGVVLATYRPQRGIRGYLLAPGLYSSLKRQVDMEANYELDVAQVERLADLFEELAKDVFHVMDEVYQWVQSSRPPPPSLNETLPRTPTSPARDDSRIDPQGSDGLPQSSEALPQSDDQA